MTCILSEFILSANIMFSIMFVNFVLNVIHRLSSLLCII